MKIKKVEIINGVYVLRCPKCGKTLSSSSNKDKLPEFSICPCDVNLNKQPAYELFERDGEKWIRRNKYPQFIARVTMRGETCIEDIELMDKDASENALSAGLRKAKIFLLKKRSYGERKK